jgi:hypothetical protein
MCRTALTENRLADNVAPEEMALCLRLLLEAGCDPTTPGNNGYNYGYTAWEDVFTAGDVVSNNYIYIDFMTFKY